MATKSVRPIKLAHYLELVSRFPLVPIESDGQLDKATAFIDELLDRKRTREEEAYLEVLGQLVEAYEDTAHPIEPASDAELLADLLESNQLTQTRLAKIAGIAESTVSAVLNGSRRLTRRQIGLLSRAFGIPADVFNLGA